MKPIVIESTETADGVLKTDIEAWKRGPTARDAPFKNDVDPAAPDPHREHLEINGESGDC